VCGSFCPSHLVGTCNTVTGNLQPWNTVTGNLQACNTHWELATLQHCHWELANLQHCHWELATLQHSLGTCNTVTRNVQHCHWELATLSLGTGNAVTSQMTCIFLISSHSCSHCSSNFLHLGSVTRHVTVAQLCQQTQSLHFN
jgi:hypothetical protein